MKNTILIAVLLFPLAAQAQPPGLADAVLKAARTAAGGPAWDGIVTVSAQGDETNSGMKGHRSDTDDVKTGRMHRVSDFGIVRTEEIWSSTGHWQRDISGGVHPIDSDFAKQLAATDAWMAERGYLKPGHGGISLGPVDMRDHRGRHYAVVSATPPGGVAIELWFDAQSHLLASMRRALPTHEETVTYEDYRTVDGVQLPFKVTTDEDDPNALDIVQVTHYKLSPKTNDSAFARPIPADDTTVTGGKVTIPIDFDGEITFDAMIDGKGPFAFILDTGGHNILTPEAAKLLGVKLEGSGVTGGAGEGTLPEQYAKIDTLQIGGVTMKDQRFFIIPMGNHFADRGAKPALAGLLGVEIFERLATRIDYVGRTMTFEPVGAYRHTGPGTTVPISFQEDIPLVPATLDGHPGVFAIDTGNAGSLVVQHVWADKIGIGEKMRAGVSLSSFGAGGESKNFASRVDTLTLGDTTLRGLIGRIANDRKGAFASTVEAGNIGNEVLPSFIVTFDYGREQMWLEPRPGFTPNPFSRSGMGLMKATPEAFTVVNIVAGSPAEKAGLKKGDTVTALDGTPAKVISPHDAVMKSVQPEGTKITMSYVRDGKPAQAEVTLRTLLP